MIYTETVISAARCAEAAWRAAGIAMENAILAETLKNPENIATVAKSAKIYANQATKAFWDADRLCDAAFRSANSDTYAAIASACAAAIGADDVGRAAAKHVVTLLEKANE